MLDREFFPSLLGVIDDLVDFAMLTKYKYLLCQNIFKEDLQKLANEIGIEIRVAHYLPYTYSYKPIEHRLFPHVTRACQVAIFTSIELVKSLIEKTSTKTGLKVVVNLIDKVYAKGREVADGFKENLSIIFDEYLPKWDYRVIPHTGLNA